MLSYDDALERVLQAVGRLEIREVPLEQALGCALAVDMVAPHDLPPFANSAMDGYAVRARDTAGANPSSPVRLKVVGEVPAGGTEVPVSEGCAVRIMTGAPVPPGADAVVMVEDTQANGEFVAVCSEARPGQHVRPAGEDVPAGEVVMRAGDELRPQHLGMLSAMGFASAGVVRKPRVALLTTGDEVVEPGVPLRRGQVRNANRYSVGAQVVESGAEVVFFRHVPDDLEEAGRALEEAA
ncbi:MAG: molybdopterin molybdotransferase MoeA, partial [Armatimonadota bacterium]